MLGILGCASNNALILCQQGQKAFEDKKYVEAYEFFKQSLRNYQSFNVTEGIAANHIMMGDIHRTLGTYHEALKSYENALKIYRELEIQEGIATTLSRMGRLYQLLGKYNKALEQFKDALHHYKKLNNIEGVATNLSSIATLYRHIGDYDDALGYENEALTIYKKLNIPKHIATILNNIGFIYHDIGKYENALSYYNESLTISKALSSTDDVYGTLINIWHVYFLQGKHKDATIYFKEAEKIKGVKWSNLFWIDIVLTLKEYDDALFLLKNRIPAWNASNSYQIRFHSLRGSAFMGNKMLKESSLDFLKAVSLAEELRAKLNDKKEGFFRGHKRIQAYEGLIAVLAERVLNDEVSDENFRPYGNDLASAAFYFSESIKARTLLEAMSKSSNKANKIELPHDLKLREEYILDELSAIENQWEDTYIKGEEAFKELVKRRENLQKELDSLISVFRKEYPMYAALNYPKPIFAEQLPLKDEEVLLEYAITDDATYLFRVKKGGVEKVIKIPKGKKEIEALVNEFMFPLQNPETKDKFSIASANKLYNLLLDEALKDVQSDKNIIIVPDGILGLLPFEALVIKEGKDYRDSLYTGDRWKITYTQSATVLSLNRLLKPSNAPNPLFAIGNPIYHKEDPRYIAYKQGKTQETLIAKNPVQYAYRGITIIPKADKTEGGKIKWEEVEYAPLLETEKEVKSIAKLFNIEAKPPDVLLNINANETNFRKTNLKDYRYIHFATHADLPGKVQGIKEPFIILGQVENETKDDGFLTMSEVLDLKLDADLVVLSACVTGKGKIMEGEGVSNFARAFHHAGARSVLVSLWEVASNETVEYMESFYRHIKQGKTKSEALTLARKEIKSKYPNPFFWAPFILHGEG
mgnify:FL=1